MKTFLQVVSKQTGYRNNKDHGLAELSESGSCRLESQVLVRRKIQQAVGKKLAGAFMKLVKITK